MFEKLKNKLFGEEKTVDAMSFKAAMDLCDLPIVTFYQGEKRFNFLLDTGANSCIIDKRVLPQIKHDKNGGHSTLFGMEGKVAETESCDITLYYKDKSYTYSYIIQDMTGPFSMIKRESGVNLHGIIGSSFFNKYKYVLDFTELIAYSKK